MSCGALGAQYPFQRLIALCSNASFSPSGGTKRLHALAIVVGAAATLPTAFYNSLISRYASFGEEAVARVVFDRMPWRRRTVASYNSVIKSYARAGDMDESLGLLSEMMISGLRPTEFTFGGILSSPFIDLCHVLQLQPLILKAGLLHGGPFPGTGLLGAFGRHGRVDDAWKIFQEMGDRSTATWNSMITELSRLQRSKDAMLLFREFLRTGIGLSEYSFPAILSAIDPYDDSGFGEQLHGLVISNGFDSYVAIGNALLKMYSSCAGVSTAEKLFITMAKRDLVSWNTMIATLSEANWVVGAMNLFSMMPLMDGFLPNESTLVSVLKSCSHSVMPEFGEFVHAKAIKLGLDMNGFIVCSLVDFYGKCVSLDNAHSLFDKIPVKSVAHWNALIGAYSTKGSRHCVVLLQEMLRSGFVPNEFSFSSGLKWSSMSELLQLHSIVIKLGYGDNEYASCALAASYAMKDAAPEVLSFVKSSLSQLPVALANTVGGVHNRIGDYLEAKRLISRMSEPDLISLNIFIAACARNGDYEEAIYLFKRMLSSMGPPDCYAAVSLLSICIKLNNIVLGASIHGLMVKVNVKSFDVFAHNVLLDMYAKCGSLKDSIMVFKEIDEKNLISWTAVISALGLHGRAHDSLMMFKQMEAEGFWPDHVSFLAVLSACRHGGLREEGISLLKCMRSEYGIEPEIDHYTCVVDLLCRCGQLKEAEKVIGSMPFQPNAAIWRIFLKGCKNLADTKNRGMQYSEGPASVPCYNYYTWPQNFQKICKEKGEGV